jgi:pilus assembly protein CpaB
MRARNLFTLLLGLVLASVAVLFLWNRFERQQPTPTLVERPAISLTKIVVARTNLYFGNRIGTEHLREVEWPADSIPQGAFKSIEELVSGTEPRTVLRTIEANEPVLASKISGAGEKATLSAIIDGEMRAMTIRVNDVVGVAGFLVPGDRVDVLLTRQEVNAPTPITDILLQNVKVLGIDQIASDNQEKPVVVQAVTVEVAPDQAQKLTLAAQVGQLTLALRNVLDTEAATARTIGVPDLRIGEVNNPAPNTKAEAAPKIARAPTNKADPRASVKIFRGLNSSEYKVDKETGTALGGALDKPTTSGTSQPSAPNAPGAPTPLGPDAQPVPEVSFETFGAPRASDTDI